jgi:hypothetical protein
MPDLRDAVRFRVYLALGLLIAAAFGAYATRASMDFAVYYGTASQALSGEARLYPEYVHGAGAPVHYFRAAPAAAWLFVPFALLPFRVAAFLFFLVKAAGLVAIVVIATRLVGAPSALRARIGLGAFVAAGGYMVEEMRYGNSHLLVLSAIVLALHLARSGRVVLPAILLAASSALKLTPLLVVCYLAITGRTKVAVASAATFVALLLLPALVYGVDVNNALLKSFAASAAQMAEQPRNHSLRGVVLRYLTASALDGPSYPRVNLLSLSRRQATAIWIAAVVVFGGVLTATILRRPASTSGAALKDSIVLIAMLLFSTHTQRIHFSWLFYPFCVLLALVLRGADGRQGTAIKSVLWGSAIAASALPIALPGRRLAVAYEMLSPYFFVALSSFFLIAWLVWRARSLPLPVRSQEANLGTGEGSTPPETVVPES